MSNTSMTPKVNAVPSRDRGAESADAPRAVAGEPGAGVVADRPIRLLVVDDQVLVRAGVRSVLDAAPDIEIVGEVASGDEAVGLLAQCRPTVALVDIDMPADGMAATRALTAQNGHPSVVVLTAQSEDERLVDALRAGASGFLTKTADEQELIAAIRAVAHGEVYVRPNAAHLLAASLRRPSAPPPLDDARRQYEALSEREQTVLRLVAEGLTGPEIGRLLGITAKTVDTYRHRIQDKIGLAHRKDYIHFALAIGLLKG